MFPCLVLVLAVVGGTPLVSVSVAKVQRTFLYGDSVSFPITANGLNGPFVFSSVPELTSLLGSSLSYNSMTGTVSGQSLIIGDFGPVFFTATDKLGNVAVSPPVFFTSSFSNIMTVHQNGLWKCEVGVACTVTPQFYLNPILVWPSGLRLLSGIVPPGMGLVSSNLSVAGIPSGTGNFPFVVGFVFPNGDVWNARVTIEVVAPLKLDLSFMQPTCDLGFNFASRLAWTGGPTIDATAGGPAPSLIVEISFGNLPQGVRFAQVATQAGSYQVPQLVGAPTQVGTFTIGLKVSDYLGGVATATYTVLVVNPPSMDLSKVSLIGEVDIPFANVILNPSGASPNYWVSTSAPSGQTSVGSPAFLSFGGVIVGPFNGSSTLVGTPSQNGTFELHLMVEAFFLPSGSSTPVVTGNPMIQNVLVTVYSKLLMPRSYTQTAPLGSAFKLVLETTGGTAGSIRFSLFGDIPPGLSLDSVSGIISGKLAASTAGTEFVFDVVATDSLNARASTTVVIRAVEGSSGLVAGEIAGIGVGATIGVVLCGVCFYVLHRKWTSRKIHAPLDEAGSGRYFKI